MTNDQNKPQSPWKLNSSRMVLLILGGILVVYFVSALLGGLGNYQQLREGALEQKTTEAPPATSP